MTELKKLLKVKTIVTLTLTALICYLAIAEKIDMNTVSQIYLMIIAFYFGTQHERSELK